MDFGRLKIKNIGSHLFVLYIVLSLLPMFGQYCTTELDTNSAFFIGEATANGVDVSARINGFYTIILLGIGSYISLFLLVNSGLEKLLDKAKRKKELFAIAAIHIILIGFNILSGTQNAFDSILYVAFVGIILIELLQDKLNFDFLKGDKLYMLFLSIISVYLVTANPYISGSLMLLLLFCVGRFDKIRQNFVPINLFASLLPLLFILFVELMFILNQRGVELSAVYASLFVAFTLVFSIWLVRKKKPSIKAVLYNVQSPVVIGGLVLFTLYSPYISQVTELFEYANKLNPLMMMSTHGQIPFVNFVSSHMASDFFWEGIYQALNGVSFDVAPLIYGVFDQLLSIILIYIFLINLTKKSFGAVVFMLFSPFLFFYIPLGFAIGLLSAIFLLKYSVQKTTKYLWYIGCISIFSIFWRVDIGVAVVGANLGVLALMFLFEKSIRKSLIKLAAVFIILGAGITSYYLAFNSSFLQELIHYFGASQAHGIHVLTYNTSNWFLIDYYVLPLLIAFILIYLLLNIKRLKGNYDFWMLIYLIGAYFFNLQRGLVRHSFVENKEHFVTSFAWLILAIFIINYLRSKNWNKTSLFVGLTIGGVLLSIHDVSNWRSIMNKDRTISVQETRILGPEKEDRVVPNESFNSIVYPMIAMLTSELGKNESFIDFSCSPMLYFYSKKKIPSIFSQYLQNTVDPFLQAKNIERINLKEHPIVVFNQSPESYYDKVDNISNKVRYYKLTRFIYENYEPYKLVGKFHVWKLKTSGDLKSEVVIPDENWNLGEIPLRWRKDETDVVQSQSEIRIDEDTLRMKTIMPGDFLRIEISSDGGGDAWLKSLEVDQFSIQFTVKQGVHSYMFPIGCSYHLVGNTNTLTISSNLGTKIKKVKIQNIN